MIILHEPPLITVFPTDEHLHCKSKGAVYLNDYSQLVPVKYQTTLKKVKESKENKESLEENKEACSLASPTFKTYFLSRWIWSMSKGNKSTAKWKMVRKQPCCRKSDEQ